MISPKYVLSRSYFIHFPANLWNTDGPWYLLHFHVCYLNRRMRKPTICICETKGADPLHSNQRLCFRYTNSTIHLLLKSEFQASSLLLRLYRPFCVEPGRSLKLLVFSCSGSHISITQTCMYLCSSRNVIVSKLINLILGCMWTMFVLSTTWGTC